ncbi:MAG TPA: hypothetical protein VJZ01_08865 [Lachnospiraceae bacterium]|nr:hypothetical protein [Lachnospiraceae bacterium]
MAFSEEKFAAVIKTKKIPLLTLDNKWHQLFTQTGKTKEIATLEKKLNDLLKKQGKLTTEEKDLKKIKTNLMTEIMSAMEALEKGETNKQTDKKLDDNKRLINEINEKLQKNEDDLLEIPKEIAEVNHELMLKTMEDCYTRLQNNTESIETIAKWISDIRIELKKNIIRKQEQEQSNAALYSYMHDIFGPGVLELFDMKYDPLKKKAEEEAIKKENEARKLKTVAEEKKD